MISESASPISSKKAICPLFDFQISGVLLGEHSRDESRKYFEMLLEKFATGIEILDDVRIRRIKHDALQRLNNYPAVNLVGLYRNEFSRIDQKTFVVELAEKDIDDVPEVESVINSILLGIRLYRPISAFCKVIWFEENSEVKGLAALDTSLPEVGSIPLSYVPRIEEMEEIGKLVKRLRSTDFNRRKSLRIACERFSRAYEKHIEDDVIVDFMIAFEALFHERKQQRRKEALSGKGQFIGLGCSMLLGENEKEREEIHKLLVKAYSIRNKIVHGDEYPTPIQVDRKKYSKYEFILKLRDYLSESIKRMID